MNQYRIELRHYNSIKTVDIMAKDHADAKQRADRQFSGWVVLSTELID